MPMTLTFDRPLARARFSASARPIPRDVHAAIEARRAGRAAGFASTSPRQSRGPGPLASFVARMAGVRRSASLAFALLLASGSARRGAINHLE